MLKYIISKFVIVNSVSVVTRCKNVPYVVLWTVHILFLLLYGAYSFSTLTLLVG